MLTLTNAGAFFLELETDGDPSYAEIEEALTKAGFRDVVIARELHDEYTAITIRGHLPNPYFPYDPKSIDRSAIRILDAFGRALKTLEDRRE